MAERLLTPEETADRLAVSPKTVRDWLRSGKIKGVKAGKLWRIRESDLETFLEAGKPTEKLDSETRAWLDADLGGKLPPYEWGEKGPPQGKPVRYVPGVGLVVEEEDRA